MRGLPDLKAYMTGSFTDLFGVFHSKLLKENQTER